MKIFSQSKTFDHKRGGTVSNAGDARPDAHEGPIDSADDAGAHVGDGLVQAAVQHAVGGGGPHQGVAGQSEGSITVQWPLHQSRFTWGRGRGPGGSRGSRSSTGAAPPRPPLVLPGDMISVED